MDDLQLNELFRPNPIPIKGTLTPTADSTARLIQRATVSGHPLAFTTTYTPRPTHIRIDGAVTNTASQNGRATDRAFQLTFNLPVNAVGWQWGDYARRARTINRGSYSYNTISVGTTGYLLQSTSRYPFATIHDSSTALSIATPLTDPRISRTQYNPNSGLSITFDLGASRAATKLGYKATFSLVIYTSNPSWGQRAATTKYYRIFPSAFVRRTAPSREGAWFVAPPLDELTDSWRDFGLGLNMIALGMSSTQQYSTWGTQYLPWDNERGFYGSAYNHHWAHYFPLIDGVVPPYTQAIAQLRSMASVTPSNADRVRRRDEALATLHSAARDFNGRTYYEKYGSKYLAFCETLDSLPNAPLDWKRAVQQHQVQQAIDLANSIDAKLNGIHLDSVSGMRRWAAVDNYNRAHWAATEMPLTFSYDSGLVVERGLFSKYQQIKRLASFLHSRGMILTANFVGNEARTGTYFGADQIDYFGHESGLQERDRSAENVTLDSYAIKKRTLAYQRPITVLDQLVGSGDLSSAAIEARVQQNLFYSVYTGAISDVEEDIIQGSLSRVTPQMLQNVSWPDESSRQIYSRYTPILRRLGAAGWEPVTNARSSNPSVWVERYGYASRNNLHLALRNETTVAQDYTLNVALNQDGLTTVSSVTALELVAGAPTPARLNTARTHVTITARIPAKSTRVLRLTVGR